VLCKEWWEKSWLESKGKSHKFIGQNFPEASCVKLVPNPTQSLKAGSDGSVRTWSPNPAG
jgi:hypothetical protein